MTTFQDLGKLLQHLTRKHRRAAAKRLPIMALRCDKIVESHLDTAELRQRACGEFIGRRLSDSLGGYLAGDQASLRGHVGTRETNAGLCQGRGMSGMLGSGDSLLRQLHRGLRRSFA